MSKELVATQWDVPVSLSGVLKLLLGGLGFLFGIVFLWAVFAELNEGAVAAGEVIPFGKQKIIQHPEGGIIRQILVKDGEVVRDGQDLIVLDDHEAKAQLALAQTSVLAMQALVDRLIAERDGQVYRGGDSANLANAAQMKIFQIRRKSLSNEIAALNKRVAGLNDELKAWGGRRQALSMLVANAGEEKKLAQGLYEKNFISRPRMLALDNQLSDRVAAKSETEAEQARVTQRISDSELQIGKLKADWKNAVLEELRRAQDELTVAIERLQVAQGRLQRTHVQSPHEGVVKGLAYSTLGAVIPPGGIVMEVVPIDDKMVVEAKVLPDDIDVVGKGTPARVRFTAYKTRSHIAYDGSVIELSPSTFRDERTGMQYYLARVAVDGELPGNADTIQLQPGMLAEVSFSGKARSPMRYLLDPLLQSLGRAFRES
ncbi:MAG: HlyD family type I secretion periplasmic adaptor subunit [bacterium]|nr:HlyD family type I secretion periplasmic adaptor subunit [bacterium]